MSASTWGFSRPPDTDSFAVGSLILSDECERLEHEQRKLSRKEPDSNN
ncbi:hypothetical protein [Halomicrococcus sp. NG-SE-24]